MRILITCFVFLFGSPLWSDTHEPQRPVVFVPGIIGSKLASASDPSDIIWGNINSLSGSVFHRMNLLPEDGEAEPLSSAGILSDLPLLFGAIEIGVYSHALDFLIGERSFADIVTGNPVRGSYVTNESFFVFDYDWRRSNFANALALDAFIAEKIPSGEFDVIAHSMGGIISRIMLSKRGPAPLCTVGRNSGDGLTETEYQDLCTAIYGAPPSGDWPSAHLGMQRESADRLHTLVEVAVPHYGSINVASTLTQGWGRTVEWLLGGKREVQNTILSMAAPMELLPTYPGCCAYGTLGASGNEAADPFVEDYWLRDLLAFELAECPYERCSLRRALFRNGIANRKIIDEIMGSGLPDTVKVNHVIYSRLVETREVLYVPFDADGDGDGVSYRESTRGDGTVHELSALPPENNQIVTKTNELAVLRAKHPFVPGDEASTIYYYNVLVNPARTPIRAVSGEELEFAGGAVDTASLTLGEKVILQDQPFDLIFDVALQNDQPVALDVALNQIVEVVLFPSGTEEQHSVLAELPLNETFSRLTQGVLSFEGKGYAVEDPGFYDLVLRSGGTELTRDTIFIVEVEE